MVQVGGLYRITYDVFDGNGAPVTPSTITLAILLPDGSSAGTTNFGSPDSVGKYHYDFACTVAGRHTGVVSTTNPVTVKGFSFDVDSLPTTGIVSLAAAKTFLNLEFVETNIDNELSNYILVVTDIVEGLIGPVVRQAVSESHSSGPSLWLRKRPVISLTSIVPYLTAGVSYAVNTLKLDKETGRVQRLDGGEFSGGPFNVTFVAGRESVPSNIRHASLEMLSHIWETQRGPRPSFFNIGPGVEESNVFTVSGREYSVPRRVLELLQPTKQGPLVA